MGVSVPLARPVSPAPRAKGGSVITYDVTCTVNGCGWGLCGYNTDDEAVTALCCHSERCHGVTCAGGEVFPTGTKRLDPTS
jgi:hypothetical protein